MATHFFKEAFSFPSCLSILIFQPLSIRCSSPENTRQLNQWIVPREIDDEERTASELATSMDSLFASGGRIRMFALLSARSLYRFTMRITPWFVLFTLVQLATFRVSSFPPIIKSLVYKKFFARFELYPLVRLKLDLFFFYLSFNPKFIYIYIFLNRIFKIYFLAREEGKLFLRNYRISFES